MAYTYDLGTSRGEVRFRIGDTSEAHAVYSDAEIDYFLTLGGSTLGAVREAIRHLMTVNAHRLDAARVAALQSILDELGGMPELQVTYPAALPMDRGYIETDY